MYHVYAIAWSVHGPSKIGVAASIPRRLHSLQCAHPFRLRVYFAAVLYDAERALDIERSVLCGLADYRMIGEWVGIGPHLLGERIGKSCDVSGYRWTRWRPTQSEADSRMARLKKDQQMAERAADAYVEAKRLGLNIRESPP